MGSSSERMAAQKKHELQFKMIQKKQAEFQLNIAKNTEKRAVRIDLIYKSRLGKTYPITVNGVTISIPVDGKTYLIPDFFADVLDCTIRQLNIEIARSQQNFGGEQGDISPTGSIPGAK